MERSSAYVRGVPLPMRKSPFAALDQQFGKRRPEVEPTVRWIRVRFGGQVIADSRQALLLLQYAPDRMPTYYFPQADVQMETLSPSAEADAAGEVSWRNVQVGDRIAADAAWIALKPPASLASLTGYVSFAWHKMDGWFEEEEEVFVHARDPHQRVDVVPSSRHVRIVVNGETIAETRRPFVLFETTLPPRYYIPREDVRMDRLEPTDLKTRCPYKGIASYWNVRTGDRLAQNIVWSYLDPIPECPKIKDLLSFYNEHVDLYVDGQLQTRPKTPWSS
jgi:uncharacterized protein (DUF427 family)